MNTFERKPVNEGPVITCPECGLRFLDRVYTLKEATAFVPFGVHTLRKLSREGKFPARVWVKSSQNIRLVILGSELAKWMAEYFWPLSELSPTSPSPKARLGWKISNRLKQWGSKGGMKSKGRKSTVAESPTTKIALNSRGAHSDCAPEIQEEELLDAPPKRCPKPPDEIQGERSLSTNRENDDED